MLYTSMGILFIIGISILILWRLNHFMIGTQLHNTIFYIQKVLRFAMTIPRHKQRPLNVFKHFSIYKTRLPDEHVVIRQPAPLAPDIEQTQESLAVHHKLLVEMNVMDLYDFPVWFSCNSNLYRCSYKSTNIFDQSSYSTIKFLHFCKFTNNISCFHRPQDFIPPSQCRAYQMMILGGI